MRGQAWVHAGLKQLPQHSGSFGGLPPQEVVIESRVDYHRLTTIERDGFEKSSSLFEFALRKGGLDFLNE